MKKCYFLVVFVLAFCVAMLVSAGVYYFDQAGYGWFIGLISCAGVLSLIWLFWLLRRVSDVLGSIVKMLKDRNVDSISNDVVSLKSTGLNNLKASLATCFSGLSEWNVELEEQKQSLCVENKLLKRQKANAEAIILSICDAVIVDESGKVVMANEAAGQLFDFDCRKVKYKALDDVVTQDKKKFVELLEKIRASKTPSARRELELTVEGEPRILDCVFSYIAGESQACSGVVAVLHDITREKEISQMKNDFVNHVSR